ncbi:MAG: hypothetical protein ACLGSD_15380 [Acidobacteriota bacterium]
MSFGWIKAFLVVSGIYDGVLGVVFFLIPATLYHFFAIAPPNHYAYVRFPALLLILFGAMFLRAAADPLGRRDVLLYGAGLKISYCAVVFWYEFRHAIPSIWIPFAWLDLAFLLLFLLAWRATAGAARA